MAVVTRFLDAANEHDADIMSATVHPDFESIQPLHPGRNFRGVDQLISNWRAIFEAEPDFHLDVVRTSTTGNTVWVEVHGEGPRADAAGILIVGVEDDLIRWVRVYSDRVEPSPEDWAQPEPPSDFGQPAAADDGEAFDEASEISAGADGGSFPTPRPPEPVVAAAGRRDPWADPDPGHREPWDEPEPDPWAHAAYDQEVEAPDRDLDPRSPPDAPASWPVETAVDGRPDTDEETVETLIGPRSPRRPGTGPSGWPPDEVADDVPHAEFPAAMLPPYEVRIGDVRVSARDPEGPAADRAASEAPASDAPAFERSASEVPSDEMLSAEVPAPDAAVHDVPAPEFPAAMLPPYEVRVSEIPAPLPAFEEPASEEPASDLPTSESPASEPPVEGRALDPPEHQVSTSELGSPEVRADEGPAVEVPAVEVRADEGPAVEVLPDEVPPDEAQSDQVLPDEVPPDAVPVDEAPVVQVRSHEVPPDEVLSDQAPPDDGRASEPAEHEVPAAEVAAAMLPPYAVRPYGVHDDETRADEIRSDVWDDEPGSDKAPSDEEPPSF